MISHRWTGANGNFFDLNPGEFIRMIEGGIEGMGMPKLPSFTQETALLDGQTVSGWKAQPRRVFWPLIIEDKGLGTATYDTFQKTFWATMRPNSYGLWRVIGPGGTSRTLRCRFVDDGGGAYSSDPSVSNMETAGVELVADDPWWKGADVSRTFQTAETPLPFYAVTSDRVFNIMSSNTVGSGTITNPGDVAAWPIYRFDGPVTGFTISDSGVGFNIASSTITLASGDYLIIDTNPQVQTATIYRSGGGIEIVTDQLSVTLFFPIVGGATSTIYATINGAGSMTVTVTPNYYRAF